MFFFFQRTAWHHDVGQAHGGLDVLLEGWLDKLVVLLDDAFDVSAPLRYIPPEPTHQADVGVRVHKNLHVQQLTARGKPTEEKVNRKSDPF